MENIVFNLTIHKSLITKAFMINEELKEEVSVDYALDAAESLVGLPTLTNVRIIFELKSGSKVQLRPMPNDKDSQLEYNWDIA